MDTTTDIEMIETTPAGHFSSEAGFSLIELMGALVVLTIMLLGLQSTLFSSIKTRASNKVQEHRNRLAIDYMQRLKKIPFGTAADPVATAAQLTELLDDDQDFGTVTLQQIDTAPAAPGYSFTTLLEGVTTDWRITINNDLDRSGVADGFREGRQDLFLVEIYAENRLMLRTFRAAGFTNTTKD